jgi:hypothetical protein
MIDERERYEQAFSLFEMPEPALDRLRDLRTRKERNRRLGAGILSAILVLVAIALVIRELNPDQAPPVHEPTPLPAVSGAVRMAHHTSFLVPDGATVEDGYAEEIEIGMGRPSSGQFKQGVVKIATDASASSAACPEIDRVGHDTSTPQELLTCIRSQLGEGSPTPTATTLAGRPAIRLRVTGIGAIVIVQDWGNGTDTGHSWQVLPTETADVYISLEPWGELANVVVVVQAPEDRFEAFLPTATAIVDSIRPATT